MLHADTASAAAGAFGVTCLIGLLALGCRCRRPRFACVVLLLWLSWLACKYAQGQEAWDDVLDHATRASSATVAALRAAWEMLQAWFGVLKPLAEDIWHVIGPLCRYSALWLARTWEKMSDEERSVLGLFLLGLCGTALALFAVAAAWRSRYAVKSVLFQFSFAALGPAIWWLAKGLPLDCIEALLKLFMSVVPVFLSAATLWQLHMSRKELSKRPLKRWFSAAFDGLLPQKKGEEEETKVSWDVEERARLWLSYWSCWPILKAADFVGDSLVDDDHAPAVCSLVLCLVVWAQFWNASVCAPVLFHVCGRFLDALMERATAAAQSFALQPYVGSLARHLVSNKWLALAFAAALALMLLQLFKDVGVVLAVIVFLAVGVESARCVARSDREMYTARLSFWILALSWQWLISVPLLGTLLGVATPIVLTVAFMAGDTLFQTVARFVERYGKTRAPGKQEPLLQADEAANAEEAGQ